MGKRAKAGDVLELVGPDGMIYVQYLGRHPDYGDGILVCPRLERRRPELKAGMFRDAFTIFYPASAALTRGLAEVVGSMPSPGLPPRYRRAGAIDNEGLVLTWIIEDGPSEELKYELTQDERMLPIAELWNHEMLFHRVREGWRPEKVRVVSDDRVALEEVMRPSAPEKPHKVSHYLYLPDSRAGGDVAAELRGKGFEVEERVGADDASWLVLATHTIVPSEEALTRVRQTMEALADAFGGEYDGWEAEVPNV